MTDIAPDWATQSAPAPTQAPAWATPQRAPGATGLGMIGQTLGDLTGSGQAAHDPNAIEQGIMNIAGSKPVKSLQANYQSAVVNGLFMQPVRAAMEGLGVGRQQGETNASLHNRYNQAILSARQDAQQQMTANTVGDSANPTIGDRAARLAQQVGNVGANVVANPQYFVLPGMGVGSNVAARVATAGVGNAAVGGVSDAAAQLMDIAEKTKKDFDVKQNIESTIAAGVFGGALHGAVEVAPFVSDLFKNRGMDTKPPADPRTQSSQITPMTTDHVAMNAADHVQYQQLLQHGSVDDIKNFFQGKQGPQPSWQDVNTWVEHRDNPPVSTNGVSGPDATQQPDFNYQDEYNNHAEQQWQEQNRTAVQDHINNQMAGWKNAPNVEVVHSPQEITDPTIREQITKEDPNNDALGFLGADGKVRVFSGRITDPDTANAVLFHEGLGHFGLAEKFGARLDQTISSMLDRNVNQLSKDTDAWQKANPGAYGGDRVRAAEEVLAEASQNGQIKSGLRDGITSAARQFGRKMGLKLSYSNGEVNHILAMAHDAVINGKPSASANGFRGTTQSDDNPNKFMYTGAQAKEIPESGPAFAGADGNFRNEISDHDARLKDWDSLKPGKSLDFKGDNPVHKLSDVLDHPTLFKAYPELRDVKVTKNPGFMDIWGSQQGSFDPRSGELNITPNAVDPLSTMLHEVQHWIQHKEDWSFGGNTNSVRLDNHKETAKLGKFYERKLDELHIDKLNAQDWGDVNEVKHKENSINSKLERLRDLTDPENKSALTSAYNAAEHFKNEITETKARTQKIADEYEADYQKRLGEYNAKNQEYNDKVKELFARQGTFLKEGKFEDARGINDALRKLREEPKGEYPRMDWEARREAIKVGDERAAKLRGKMQELTQHIEGIKGKYSDLSYDLYHLIAGEREARDVQARQNMTPEERTGMTPYTHEGIRDDEVIHVSPDVGSAQSVSPGEKIGQQADEDYRNAVWGDTPQARLLRAQRTLAEHGGDHPDARAVADHASDELGVPRIEDVRRNVEKPETIGDHFFNPNGPEVNPEDLVTRSEQSQKIAEARANGPKFIMRSQAAEPGYQADDLREIYRALDEGYTPTTRTWGEERTAALALGFSPSQMKSLHALSPGELSTRMWRLQAAANMARGRIAELNEKLGTPEWSAADQAQYVKALADRAELAVRIKGDRAEIARAQNVSKAASAFGNRAMEQVAELLREEGSGLADITDDPTRFMKVATKIKELMDSGNPDGADKMMSAINKPYWEQYLTTFHYNAMLSGLSTHVKAPLDMMTGIAHSIIDHTLAMPIGKMANVIEGLTGQVVKPGITANEVAARMYGVARSVFDHEVYVKTLEALKTGEGSAVLPSGKSVPTNPGNTYMGTSNPRLGLLSKPTDLIVAQDTFFRSHSVSETLYGLGAREAEAQLKASGTPYTRDDVLTLGATIAHNPTPTMLKTARAEAEKMLLLNPNRLTSWIDKVKSIGPGASIPERFGSFVANNLAPFIRVAANSLTTRVLERSPLAILSPTARRALAAGGPEAHLVMARVAYGTVKLGLLWSAAAAVRDKLTGEGPENPDKKKEYEAAGFRPNAVHEDGRFNTGGTLAMSLNPFDLHNSTAQMVASMRDAYEKGANQGKVGIGLKLALGSILHTFEAEMWVDSIAPAVEAASSTGTSAGAKVNQFVGDQAKTWVPNILNQIGRQTNPNQVDTRASTDDVDPTNLTGSIINNVQSAIPGLNSKLPTRYSVYGNPIPTGQSIEGVHTIIPGLQGNGVKETTDPTEIELNRLAKLTKAAIVTPVQRSIKLEDGTPKKLNAAEFQNYQRVAGRAIVETIKQEMSTSEWQSMSDQDKVLEIRSVQTDMKKAAREALFENGGA